MNNLYLVLKMRLKGALLMQKRHFVRQFVIVKMFAAFAGYKSRCFSYNNFDTSRFPDVHHTFSFWQCYPAQSPSVIDPVI